MNSNHAWLVSCLAIVLLLSACATPQSVTVNPVAVGRGYKWVFLVAKGDTYATLDKEVEKALTKSGFNVTSGGFGNTPVNADLVVEYDCDSHMIYFVDHLTLRFYDGKSRELVATSAWRNSTVGGFHNFNKIVDQLVAETHSKLGSAVVAPATTAGEVSER
jgi:hypothetical protein